jgi:hypothetical protein
MSSVAAWNSGQRSASFGDQAPAPATSSRIAREDQRAAIRRWREDRRLGPHDVQPLLLEAEIAGDVVADDARVRESGSAKPLDGFRA